MKSKIIISALVVITVVLGASLTYQTIRIHRGWRNVQIFQLVVFEQLYQNLDRGEIEQAKHRLGALVSVTVDNYQHDFRNETNTNYLAKLSEANVIKAEDEAWVAKWQQEQKTNQAK